MKNYVVNRIFIVTCYIYISCICTPISAADTIDSSYRWQYHFTTPLDKHSPSTGIVFRAVCPESGEEYLRNYINQNSDGNRTRFYSIVQKLEGGHVLRLSYERGIDNIESLIVTIENKMGDLVSDLSYIKNRRFRSRTPDQIVQYNKERRILRNIDGPLSLEQFPWMDLDGSIHDQSGSYAPPLPVPTPTGREETPVVESEVVDTDEIARKVIGNDDMLFRFDIYERHGGGRRGRAYALPKERVGQLPKWKEGERMPLSVDRAVEVALAYERNRLGSGETSVVLHSVGMNRFSTELYEDMWYYLVRIDIEGGTGDRWYPQTCVLMDGSVLEPRYVDLTKE